MCWFEVGLLSLLLMLLFLLQWKWRGQGGVLQRGQQLACAGPVRWLPLQTRLHLEQHVTQMQRGKAWGRVHSVQLQAGWTGAGAVAAPS